MTIYGIYGDFSKNRNVEFIILYIFLLLLYFLIKFFTKLDMYSHLVFLTILDVAIFRTNSISVKSGGIKRKSEQIKWSIDRHSEQIKMAC